MGGPLIIVTLSVPASPPDVRPADYCDALRSGFAARCEAGLRPAGGILDNRVGLCPWCGLCPFALKAKGRTRGIAPNFLMDLTGRAWPCLTSGGEAGAVRPKFLTYLIPSLLTRAQCCCPTCCIRQQPDWSKK